MGTPVSGVPFSGHETVSERIGFLMHPPKDRWWIINGHHHVLELPDELLGTIGRCAFPWFEAGHDIETAIVFAMRGRHTATIRALRWLKDEWIGYRQMHWTAGFGFSCIWEVAGPPPMACALDTMNVAPPSWQLKSEWC
jgi:hypothetical protein